MKIPRLLRWICSIAIGMLLIMSLLRLGYGWYFKPAGTTASSYFTAMILGVRFDLRIVGIVSLITLLLGSVPFLSPFRNKASGSGWKLLFYLLSIIFFFIYTVDFAHHSYLGIRLNASVLTYLEDAAISGGMVWETYPVIRLFLLIVGAGLLMGWWIARRYRTIAAKPEPVVSRGKKAGWIIGSFLVMALAVFGRLGQYPLRWSDAFGSGNDFAANLSLNPFQSFASSLKFRHIKTDLKAVREGYPIMKEYLGIDNPGDSLNFSRFNPGNGISVTDKNIVVVICESFSGYKSSMWGNPLNTTPYFNDMCRNGVFFDYCFTPHIGTARGVWATITGIPDVEQNNTASRNPGAVDQHTIINEFKEHDKYYFLGGSTSWANIRGLLANNILGLKIYEQDDFNSPKEDVWGISDKRLFLEANAVFKKQQKPFFAIIQTANNHRPYTIPNEDLPFFKKLDLPLDTLQKYGYQGNDELNAFRYMDYCFANYIDTAKQEAYFKNTLFVFIGDHGIGGNANDMLPKAFTERGLTKLHVPLLFYAPGWLAPQKRSDVCSQVDLLPTAAGITGIPYRNSTLGRNLLDSATLAADSGRSNRAFFIHPDLLQLGIMNDKYLYYRFMKTGVEEILPYRDNVMPSAEEAARVKQELSKEASAFYNTSNYMLFHNQKRN